MAMKVQAMQNAPERTWQDMADIALLLSLDDVDRAEAKSGMTSPGGAVVAGAGLARARRDGPPKALDRRSVARDSWAPFSPD